MKRNTEGSSHLEVNGPQVFIDDKVAYDVVHVPEVNLTRSG